MTRLTNVLLMSTIVASIAAAGFSKTSLPLPQLRSDVRIADLRCEYMTNPLGIDVVEPRLNWKLQSPWRGQKQTAYQILVATDKAMLADDRADLWDTGKVVSDQSIFVRYAGRSLTSRVTCYWKVRVWDADDKASSFSDVAFWEMGLLAPADWQGKWLTAPIDETKKVQPAPLFRKGFILSDKVKRARVYICGLGFYELRLNGEKVGDHVLDPAFTRYDRRTLYVTYDVTDQLRSGFNALGVVLANGWYDMGTRAAWDFDQAPWRDRATLRCQLELTFTDGTQRTIATDGTWRVAPGPLVYHSIRKGQIYDARLEIPGWDAPEFHDEDWALAPIGTGPKGIVTAQMQEPVKVTDTLKPVSVNEPQPGVYVFDLGQNIAGWVRMRLTGPRGTQVVLRYAERLHEDGTIDQKDIAEHVKESDFQTETYILKGEGVETWESQFVYHGFQYVEATGLPQMPGLDLLEGRVVHTAFDSAGSFECSNELFNKIQQCTRWAYVSNFVGYPTDCPHREKNGWTGDAHLAAETGLYNFASAAAYTKWMTDLKDEQRDSGELPGIVPTGGWGYQWGNGPAWDSAYLLIPWYMYEYCGDAGILAAHYERFKRYVDYLTSKAKDGIVSIGLNDWAPANSQTPTEITSTGYYYCDTLIVAKIASMLGKTEDARKYGDLALHIRDAFNREFFDVDAGIYRPGTQTAMSCALYHRLVPPQHYQRVLDNLVAIIEKNDGRLDAGILGTKYLIDALTAGGRADVVYTMANQTTFPSWGLWITQGATTLWEQWNGTSSRNHIMFGHISAWFYEVLAGIMPDPDAVGFKHFVIKPQLLGDVTWVRAEHESPYGTIRSNWEIQGDQFILKIAAPVNTTATVYLPCDKEKAIVEGPDYIHAGDHAKFLRVEKDCVVFEVESGAYEFISQLPGK